jgi:hypothetical protein
MSESEAWREMLARVNAAEMADRRREAERERRREERERAERQERAEDRREMWAAARRAEFRRTGRDFNPFDDRSLMLTEQEILARGYAWQDRAAAEARTEARKLLAEHGLLDAVDLPHYLDAPVVGDEDATRAEGVSSRVSPSAGASRAALRSKIRTALARMSHKATRSRCGCAACDPRALRAEDSDGGPITRTTKQ